MKCGIAKCTQNDNRFLWRCFGTCRRTFHAACIGAQRNHEEILRTFVLPLCQECQERFITELDMKALTTSLFTISNNIGNTLETNHKLASNFKNLSATHDEALESMDKMLHEIQEGLKHVVISIKTNTGNIMKALAHLDIAPDMATFEAAAKTVVATMQTTAAAATTSATTTTSDSINKILSSFKNDLVDSNVILASEVKAHMDQLAKSLHTTAVTTVTPTSLPNLHRNSEPIPSWRFLGSKKVWKRDWAEYDARQNRRGLQEKKQDKARRRRKQRKRQQKQNCNNNNINDFKDNSTSNTNKNCNNIDKNNNNNNRLRTSAPSHAPLPLDKELLAAARMNFSGPPLTTEHPIAALSTKFINFRQGETINPYRAEHHTPYHENATFDRREGQQTYLNTNDPPPPLLDPMRPPVVRLTEQSTTGDRRYLKARLRDQKIRDTARTFLSYLHDQPPTVCICGITRTSASVMLAAEGLPTDTSLLREIFLDTHEELGISRHDTLADLEAHRAFLSSERTQRLQQAREAAQKFYNPSTFQRR